MSLANLDLVLAHYEGRRSDLNRKFAWCCVLPPLGWFGRLERIEAEHARVNTFIHDALRAAYTPEPAVSESPVRPAQRSDPNPSEQQP